MSNAGKTKARSTLDRDLNFKKEKENGVEEKDSDDSYIIIDIDQTQQPMDTNYNGPPRHLNPGQRSDDTADDTQVDVHNNDN